MIPDKTVIESDIINYVTNPADGQEELNSMTADKIYAGI